MAWVWPDEPLPGEGKKRRHGKLNVNNQTEPTSFSKNKSEQGGIDFRTYENLTTLTAPFGTNNTPVLGTKIIGGQAVSVLEHLSPNQYDGSGGFSITKLNDIADKPNNVNPDLLRRGARTYFSAQQPKDDYDQEPLPNNQVWDNFQSHLHGKPTYIGRNRPDSKSLSRGLKLDPLQTNKNKNQLSTIFEPEIGNPNALQLETEYTDKYMNDTEYDRPVSDQNRQMPNGQMYDSAKYPKALSDIGPAPVHQSQPPAKDANSYPHNELSEQTPRTVLNEERNKLLKYLWSSNPGALPQRPIELSLLEEEKLGHIVSVELDGIPRKRLDKVHADVITSDWAQNGTCALVAMKKALEANAIRLDPDTVRLAAAKFVDRNQNGWIFYRDFVRYLKKFLPKEPQSNADHRFQSQPNSPMDDLNPRIHRTLGMTLKIAKQQLEDQHIKINMSAIRRDFESKDKPHTGRLNELEIFDVMYKNGVKLPSNVFKDLLYMKRRPPPDGLHDWEAFLRVLEMLQPDATGLELPRSKQPLEYAKPTLEMYDTWPTRSPRRDNPPYDGYRQQSNHPHEEHWQRDGYQPSFTNGDAYNQGYNGNTSYRREHSPSRAQQMSYRADDVRYPPIDKYPPAQSPRQLQDEISKMENEIKALQDRNEKLELIRNKQEERQTLLSTITSLGKSLYGIDERSYRSSGRVHITEVVEESMKYRLPLPRQYLEEAASRCRNAKGMVDIEKYLDLVKGLVN
ncbi:uncharacterized protein LOC117325206 isoform X3 [Pecten maximus]|uniref:uncharacterized protein LOC117325206 isoform X3 n=1 Tax=Pecten maximus TaxID=6579 RepID=UPI001458E0B3|nr:uncharacterized protein LOC117325206 isoform X3 [Pecten maximus]